MSAQMILVSNNTSDVKKAKGFSKKNGWSLASYTKEEWGGKGDEIFLVHNEDESALVKPLPSGHRPVFSLEEIEAYTIEKVLSLCKGNASKAARLLRIGRATLYRKIERLGLQTKSDKDPLKNNVLKMQAPFKKRIRQVKKSA